VFTDYPGKGDVNVAQAALLVPAVCSEIDFCCVVQMSEWRWMQLQSVVVARGTRGDSALALLDG
jgi:hypothetical protein